jgi:hypothetical protein
MSPEGDGLGPARPAPLPPARLTIVGNIYHEPPEDEAGGVELRFTVALASTERRYTRKVTLGPDWAQIDLGWLGPAVGFLVLQNDGDAKKGDGTIELGGEQGSSTWAAPPGECFFGRSTDVARLRVRAISGRRAVMILTLFPA